VNHVWAYDFVLDTCADGRILKCLTVIDEFTRECLAIDVADESFNGKLRDRHLSPQWFRNCADAKVSIEAWRRRLALM
jgi:transposase InsO family protein